MRILVFGAHPDDMEVGMGGTIAKHVNFGDSVTMVVGTVPSMNDTRRDEARRGAAILGGELRFLDIESDAFEYNRALVGMIDAILKDVRPDMIYTQWDQDSHQDHNNLSRGVISACRKNQSSLYMYEQTIPGGIVPGGFNPQSYVDISDTIGQKADSVLAHVSQVAVHGDLWVEGVKGRCAYRGYQIHVAYAEAFEVVKEINGCFADRGR
jgi:LmbE family N-acetylglucosaminyl deacetylase